METSSPIDPAYLADIFAAGGDALVQDVLATFEASVLPRAVALREAATGGDVTQVASAAHAIVSAAAQLGLVEVEMLARALEHRARGGEPPPPHAPARLERAAREGVTLLRQAAARLGAERGPTPPEAPP